MNRITKNWLNEPETPLNYDQVNLKKIYKLWQDALKERKNIERIFQSNKEMMYKKLREQQKKIDFFQEEYNKEELKIEEQRREHFPLTDKDKKDLKKYGLEENFYFPQNTLNLLIREKKIQLLQKNSEKIKKKSNENEKRLNDIEKKSNENKKRLNENEKILNNLDKKIQFSKKILNKKIQSFKENIKKRNEKELNNIDKKIQFLKTQIKKEEETEKIEKNETELNQSQELLEKMMPKNKKDLENSNNIKTSNDIEDKTIKNPQKIEDAPKEPKKKNSIPLNMVSFPFLICGTVVNFIGKKLAKEKTKENFTTAYQTCSESLKPFFSKVKSFFSKSTPVSPNSLKGSSVVKDLPDYMKKSL